MALTPFALENKILMRRLAAGDFASKTELAQALDRDLSNLNKTLKRLADEGLVTGVTLTILTEAGANAVRDLERLEAAAAGGEGYLVLLRHDQIAADPDNARKDFDPEALAELADSMFLNGLKQKPSVRPDTVDGVHTLTMGERRWRAWGLLIEDGRWPADHAEPCWLDDAVDDISRRRGSLIENLQRRDLKPLEEARALQALAELTGASAAQLGRDLGFTERWAQQRLALLAMPEPMQKRMESGDLKVEEGRQVVSIWAKLPVIKQIELRDGKITVAEAKAWVERMPKPLDLSHERELVLLEVAWAIAAKTNGWWTSVPCDHAICSWGRALEAEMLLMIGVDWRGAVTVQLTRTSFNHICAITGADEHLARAGIEPHLRKARIFEAGGSPLAATPNRKAHEEVDELFKSKQYVTKWLNAPFRPDPATAAERAEDERKREERAASEAPQRAAAEAQREADAEAGRQRMVKAREILLALNTTVTVPTPAADLAAIVAAEHPLPWKWLVDRWGDSGPVDADGDYVSLDDGDSPAGMVIMALVNACTGHTSVIEAEPAEPQDEDADEADADDTALEAAE